MALWGMPTFAMGIFFYETEGLLVSTNSVFTVSMHSYGTKPKLYEAG